MRIYLFVLSFLLTLPTFAQIETPVKWKYSTSAKEAKVGQTIELIFTAEIQEGWHMFSSDFSPDLGPIVATFSFEKHPSYSLEGKIKPSKPKKKFDDIFGGDYTYFEKVGIFKQKVKLLQHNPIIVGEFKGQACTNDDGKCVPLNDDFEFKGIKVLASVAPTPVITTAVATTNMTR